MLEKRVGVVGVIKPERLMSIKWTLVVLASLVGHTITAQPDSIVNRYKKRVLETVEIDFLSSYYQQTGENAAVSGGRGTESLSDATATIIVAIPLNEDDVFSIDAGVSAYTSASSSNVNPFDGGHASPFIASSGESKSDVWSNVKLGYSHYSDDRNKIWGATLSVSAEYDYTSVGFGGTFAKLSNAKNTEWTLHGSAYFDRWSRIYPVEFRSPSREDDDEDFDIRRHRITGNRDYDPVFVPLARAGRNSFTLGASISQIFSKKWQGSLAIDLVLQEGLLSTPFQRVYFEDVGNAFIEDFHLADDIERLPSNRFKLALGGRLHHYLSEWMVLRSFYRFYWDSWKITSLTGSLEIPIKIWNHWTIYPSYRFYTQTAADYFKPYDRHSSNATFYTSDFDLSNYSSNQWGIGLGYTDLFSKLQWGKSNLKSIDLKYYKYARNNPFRSGIVTLGVKLAID